ncbi:hypothetical protein PVAND_015934 [Polypedilum vanderplanki]|uniref:Ionotropic glutamate receptor C-terminal domain-containing protein n=1 Tax=Polypedilum vanderplanki TaxID=319348 RepID=A0A9J6BEE7_POLVA|nr:hypothetical protein PVAND_015934 [Polypedilum vanderplanki]
MKLLKLPVLCAVLLVFISDIKFSKCDDFPSLITQNASIAIIIDREYLDVQYEDVLKEIKVIIERVLREDLKNGGLVVFYYAWTKINLRKDFTAVFSITNCENTWEIYRDSRGENLLLMAITDPDCPRLPYDEGLMIPIMTPGEELPQLILDTKARHSFDWKSAVLLYDNTFDRDMISRCVIALSRNFPDDSNQVQPLSVSVYKIRETSLDWNRRKHIRNILTSLPSRFIGTNYMVLVTTELMQTIMEIARDLKMVNTFSQWFYVVSDTNYKSGNMSTVLSLLEEGNNIAFIYNYTSDNGECVSGIKCHSNEILRAFTLGLSQAIREELAVYGQISDEEWEIIRPSKVERRGSILNFILEHLRKTSSCSNCTMWKIETADIWGSRYQASTFTSQSVAEKKLQIDSNVDYALINAGMWRPFEGLLMNDVLFPHISHGFRKKVFHIITYHNPPWQYIKTNGTDIVSEAHGVVIDILNEISKKLNFTFVLHTTSTSTDLNTTDETTNLTMTKEIRLLTTDLPTEVASMLNENKILLAAVASTVNDRYKNFLNFSIPISIQPYSFIVAKPKELSRIYLFTAPYTHGTWLCLALMIVILPPILCLVNRISPYYEFHNQCTKKGLFKFSNCFWYIYGALLQQGGLYLPQADSGRLIIGTWWLIVIVLVTTYCGNLVAFLTFPRVDVQVKTVGELVRQSAMSWGMRSGTYFEDYIRDSNDIPKYETLYKGAKFHSDENPEIIDLVRQGKHVYIDWKSNLLYIMRREYLKTETCDFALSSDEFMEEQIAIILPYNSPYLELFNVELTRLHQMGLIQRWIKEYLPKKDRCSKQSNLIEVVNHVVTIDDMQGSFLVLLLGFMAGLLIFCTECTWRYYRKRREEKIIQPFVE